MKMNIQGTKKNRRSLAPLETALFGVIILMIVFIGWYVWHSTRITNKNLDQALMVQNSSSSQSIKTFAECTKGAGSIIEQSYPEICVAKDGQRFTSPSN